MSKTIKFTLTQSDLKGIVPGPQGRLKLRKILRDGGLVFEGMDDPDWLCRTDDPTPVGKLTRSKCQRTATITYTQVLPE